MKRFLNLNELAPLAFKIIGIITVAIPGFMWLLYTGFEALGRRISILLSLARFFFLIGVGLLLIMLVLILAEQVQDHILFRQYDRSLKKRLPGSEGLSECPACGYRGLRPFEGSCPVCGKELE